MELLQNIAKIIRKNILEATTAAGSGHPTSSLSAVELMTVLYFGGFLQNDKVIFSKGHASPLLYSIYQAAGIISREELLTLRKFGSRLEGHPTPKFPDVDVATGSLGQGLSIGVGMCLGFKLKKSPARAFVLLGDSELAEGQNWEALQIASYYRLNNLIGILDVNRLGQRGETMLGWDIATYEKRIASFGWKTIVIEDGHDLKSINNAFQQLTTPLHPSGSTRQADNQQPTMIIAKTIKGKGVSFLENQDSWHGKPVPPEKLAKALKEIGEVDLNSVIGCRLSENQIISNNQSPITPLRSSTSLGATSGQADNQQLTTEVSTREAYGNILVELGKKYSNLVVLDAETSNSTMAEKFKQVFPERFFEMFIAEQNMISVAVGLSKVGFIPFASSFAAFLTRSFDQIRMAQYSNANIKIAGSHAGVSIGADGSSQMALEDISMMRSILNSKVLYPADAIATKKIAEEIIKTQSLCYLRLTREKTPIIYSEQEQFPLGGSKILKQSDNDRAVIFTAGITLFEALKAYEELQKEGINIAVVDLYSIKPLDKKTIDQFSDKVKNVITVEDHYPDGGIGETVKSAIKNADVNFYSLSVRKIPCSGTTQELLNYEEIDSRAIIAQVKAIL